MKVSEKEINWEIIEVMCYEGDFYQYINADKLRGVVIKQGKLDEEKAENARQSILACIDYDEKCEISSSNDVDHCLDNEICEVTSSIQGFHSLLQEA